MSRQLILAAPASSLSSEGSSKYLIGSISPSLQHDANFVKTQYKTPTIPSFSLMPVAQSGLPSGNAAIESIVTPAVIPPFVQSGLVWKGDWNSHTFYKINDVVQFNASTYVSLMASTGTRPDTSTATWALASENFVFDGGSSIAGHAGFGSFLTNSTATGVSGPATSGPLTPANATGWAILGSSISNGVPGLTGWLDLGRAAGFPTAGLYAQSFDTASPISTSQTNGSTNWATNLLLFEGAGLATSATVTSTSVSSNVLTCVCTQSFVVGTRVTFGTMVSSFLTGQTIIISSRTATTFSGTFVHADYTATSENGTGTNYPFLSVADFGFINTGTHTTTLTGATAGSTVLIVALVNDVNGSLVINTLTDTSGDSYHIKANQNGAGSTATLAYAENIAGGSPVISINITSNNTFEVFAIELPGGGTLTSTSYLPYDVAEFRGSMFVCHTETSLDAFDDPSSWWLVAQGTGYVDALNANYTPDLNDYGRLIRNSSTSNYTVTLPAPPSDSWWVCFQNSSSGTIIIDPNGRTLDGSTSTLTLRMGQGLFVFTDGVNYFTVRGYGSVYTTGTPVSGNLTKFSGADSITNGDLSGDVATSGTLVTTIQPLAVTTGKIAASAVTEAKIGLSDVTTDDVSITKHGFAPKAPNDATKFLDGTGAYSVPSGAFIGDGIVEVNGVIAATNAYFISVNNSELVNGA
jgi:hypothetical protein